jgi:DNA repair protein RadC
MSDQRSLAEAREASGPSYRDAFKLPAPAARPRERLAAFGPQALSDRELLAILLNTGTRGKGVMVLADELSAKLDGAAAIPAPRDLAKLAGLGQAKASAVAAMLEYGRRRWGPCGARIGGPGDAYPLLRHYADRRQERFIAVSLNGAHEVLAVRVVSIGLVNRTIVHPREVFADVLTDRANAVLVAHNHPSGRLEPSAEDEDITRRLEQCGELLGVSLLDHLIFTEYGYFSFLQGGLIKRTEE